MATHSSILAWKIPWIEEPGRRYCPRGHKELDMTEHLSTHALCKNCLYLNDWGSFLAFNIPLNASFPYSLGLSIRSEAFCDK